MKLKKLKLLAALLAALLLVSCGGNSDTPAITDTDTSITSDGTGAENEETPDGDTVEIASINKYGNVILNLTPAELNAMGIEAGDTVLVTVGDLQDTLPVGTAFSDVDSGNSILRIDTEDNQIMLAINMGNFAESAGIGVKTTITEDPGYSWTMNITEVSIALSEKEGYISEYTLRQLTRTNVRSDYTALTDEQFANFRNIATTGIKAGVLYRSTSPIDPALGRNEYAMAAMEKAGIKVALNLTNTESEIKAFSTYEGSYYSRISVLDAVMTLDFTSADFTKRVGECVRTIAYTDGPFLIHCLEGKDRTGVLCAVIECYMGASYDEVCNDYMITYENFYGIDKNSDKYGLLLDKNLVKTLCTLYDVSDLSKADLQKEAEEYLVSAGLTAAELAAMKAKLG